MALDAVLTSEQREALADFDVQQLLSRRIVQSQALDEAYLTAGRNGLGFLPSYFGFDWTAIDAVA
ncbi:MAG: hypothetical protein AAF414_20390, partial [Pseudomonadota bacterium]